MEPFKNYFSHDLIEHIANTLASLDGTFNSKKFVQTGCHNLDSLELKERSQQITQALIDYLPSDYGRSIDLMVQSLAPMKTPDEVDTESNQGIHGWAIMPMCDVVSQNGLHQLDYFDASIDALFSMTQRFSAEFAIRPFLDAHTERTLEALKTRLDDPSHHVRRLISEGTRPRLPWGMRLSKFIERPAEIVPFLTALRDDDSEYVRRSVANNLNDIAKDHPDLVASIATDWSENAGMHRKKLIKHACRTLLKQGHQKVLSLYGYHPPKFETVALSLDKSKLKVGEALTLSLSLQAPKQTSQNLLIDYIVYHQKANGTMQPKVFKWTTVNIGSDKEKTLIKTHSFKVVTTRKYYPGEHKIAILINGKEFVPTSFELVQ